MTGNVSAQESSPTEIIRRIGPELILGSVLGSTFGIVLAQFLDDLGDGILALIFGADAVVFNNRAEFSGVSDIAWAGGFLLCLIVGLLTLVAYPGLRGEGIAKLTVLWILLHLLRQAMTQAVFLPLDSGGELALAYATLDVPPGLDVVIAVGGGLGILLIALSAAAAFLGYAPQHRLVSTGRRRFSFALWIALIPAVVSVFLAIAFFVPDAGSGVVPELPLAAVPFLATLAAAPGTTTVQGPEEEQRSAWPWGLVVTLVIVLLVEQLILGGGVSLDPRQWG